MTAAAKKSAATEAFDALTFKPETFRDGYEKFAKGFSTLAEFQKSSLEAFIQSTGSIAKGVEKATSDQTAFVKATYEDGIAAAKAAASSKSVQEALEIQSEYLRSTLEKNIGQFNKLADHWVTTTKEVAEPLTSRYGAFVEMVQSYRP
jgi:phasin family protein